MNNQERPYVHPNGASGKVVTTQLALATRPKSYAADMCDECGIWPKLSSSQLHGLRHPFCSKTCARKHISRISTVPLTPVAIIPDLCVGCGLYPQNTEDGYQYPHCRRSCALKWPVTQNVCALSSCSKRTTGAFDQYCCMAHLDQAHQNNVRTPLSGPLSARPRSYPAPVPLRHFSRSAPPPASATNRILFYDKDKPFYGFTNFSYHPVQYKGKSYPTSEHLFQAFKFLDHQPSIAKHIRKFSDKPSDAFAQGRAYHNDIRPDWHRVKISKMDEVLYLKFTQHPTLLTQLLGTGQAELVEDSKVDAFWGVGHDGKGRNELGKALMRLRDNLRHRNT